MAKVKLEESTESLSNNLTTLDDILVALQKSFSRLTDQTNENEGTTAQMVGEVDFELKAKFSAQNDSLIHDREGGIELTFTGTIDLDINDEEK